MLSRISPKRRRRVRRDCWGSWYRSGCHPVARTCQARASADRGPKHPLWWVFWPTITELRRGERAVLVAFSVTPLGVGEGVGEVVAEAVRVVRESGLPNQT